ncbi:hypothetical protein [Modestobacter italicus]|uniref:hypothetical protein n=1 Tax=Modestobacter italicus (strain DSM 44449 / CECT 9708 / BC 501) TaxID=2732864 RepID=UPI001C93DF30|nr:hypothetical protein [Modestobacter italicus]
MTPRHYSEMSDVVQRVFVAAGERIPDSGGPGIDWEQQRVVIRWHGELPSEVQAVVDAAADEPFEVVVVPIRFRPGDLLAEAHRLLEAHPGVVTGAGLDGAEGLHVWLAPELVAAAGSSEAVVAEHRVSSAWPLSFEANRVEPC